jgi:hypothetical protein
MLGKIFVVKPIKIVCILVLLTACGPNYLSKEENPDHSTQTASLITPAPPQTVIPKPDTEAISELPMSEDGNFIEHQVAYGTFDYVSGITLYDIDNDGFLDIIGTAIKEKEVAWWRNNGEYPIVWEKQVIGKMAQGALYVHANDFDRDGDGDVISTGIFDEGTISL